MSELLSFHDLYYEFAGNTRYIKESGAVSPNSVLTIKGSSGVGKSTLLKILARLIKADGGEVYYKNQSWDKFLANEWRLNVQYLSQQPVMYEGSVKDNLLLPFTLKMVSENRDSPSQAIIIDYLSRLGLKENILDQSAKTLSGGEKARISILRAVLINPSILLLDEPSAYLDETSREKTMKFLNNWVLSQPRSIIMVSHNPEDLGYIENYNILNLIQRGDENGR